ncbi:hypothetical protein H6761_02870 [Candidatus Nomurabacteria bacterium]|nr:hypothetical protein [Candidatus Nomurabacteria bacterium]
MICKECATHPDRVNVQRINADLKQSGWTEKDAQEAARAIGAAVLSR